MTYKMEVKENVQKLYQQGLSCGGISESEGIPLSTVRSWTVDLSRSKGTIVCAGCNKINRVTNIQRKYCSEKCRQKAKYQRRLKRANKLGLHTCDCCGKQYQPTHRNTRYCSSKCRTSAIAFRKRERIRQQAEARLTTKAQLVVVQAQLIIARADFLDSLKRCEAGIKAAINDSKISRSEYGDDIDIIEHFYNNHRNEALPFYVRVQKVFNSVRSD